MRGWAGAPDMTRIWAFAAMVLALGGASPGLSAPLETYGRPPSIESVRISPDGQMLAFAATLDDQRKVVVQSVDQGQVLVKLAASDRKLRDLLWAGPRHLIVITSITGAIRDTTFGRREWFTGVDIDVANKVQRPLVWGVPDAMNVVEGSTEIRFIDGRPFAFASGESFFHNRSRPTLFRVDLDSGKTSLLLRGVWDTSGFVVDGAGGVLATSEFDPGPSTWILNLWRGKWGEVDREDPPIEQPRLLGLGRDGASVLVASRRTTRPSCGSSRPTAAAGAIPCRWTIPTASSGARQPTR